MNNLWQVAYSKALTSGTGIVLIFGAYFDARPNIYKETVRVLGVSTTSNRQSIFCQLWYANQSSPVIVQAVVKDTGRGLGVGGTKYQERLYSCEISQLVIAPHSVSLAFSNCENSTTLIPVHFPSPVKVHDFGICVVIAYGTLNPVALVDWVEFNLLLGVGEINIYDSKIDDKSRQLFQYYQSKGIVNIHQSAPPIQNNWCKWCQKLAVIPALNDCMYRNMFRYKHLVVIDFDELIIPIKHSNLSTLISHLRSTWNIEPASYMFHNAYFFKEFSSRRDVPNYLTSLKYLNRTEPSKYGYSPKSIINPKRCVIMQNHYCMVKTPDLPGSGLIMNVQPQYALSHHYKSCHLKPTECTEMLKKPVLDLSALRFETALTESVHKRLFELNILS